ncbi:uncharacterized protein LOC115675378 isoform X3 [Syzygium oleosum]|uniref:uncharacterized protein LOC115675378 isoform X3 n=1 Tax=Syzygium oleosum TaxID=219896 RepID=UPI0024B93ECC|nr:uncharacterized protein LOC115675378 isoform X3 [Syzygium oleosum]
MDKQGRFRVGFFREMAAKPLMSDAIALTEKKMDMTLDEIIKMSKNPANKAKKFRPSQNKSQRSFRNAAKEKSLRYRHFMDTRSSLRQGALARKRSNFQPNHFPLATEAARKAGVNPFGGRAFNRDRTAIANRPRAGGVVIQKRIANGAVAAKQKENESNAGAKQRPKTLDSLFADLKEQRMKAGPRQINTVPRQINTVPRNRGGHPIPPWHRARFRN